MFSPTSSTPYDALGQLKNKSLGNGLETQAYDYNIRGWLLGVNRSYVQDVAYADPAGTGEDFTTPRPAPYAGHFFGFDLGYDRDGVIDSYGHQLNGNIGGMTWKSAHDAQVRKYDFTYDAVNRLANADFNQYTSGGFNKYAGVDFSSGGLAYDANGNIKAMTQIGLVNNHVQPVDILQYAYQPNSNKLQQVSDGNTSNNGEVGDFKGNDGNYHYDANGNMDIDPNKNISKITYNYLNLPQQIDVGGKGTINYVYDAGGNKLQKFVTEGGAVTKNTVYLGGIVYENDALQFISNSEGRIRPNSSLNGFVFDYYLKDHLGNTRMTITDDATASTPILDATSYYPFGLAMAGISSKASGALENKYKFGCKEIQHQEFSDGSGLEWMDFEARMMDGQTGRTNQQDPHAKNRPSMSPYAMMGNNPVNRIDPSGMDDDWVQYTVKENGRNVTQTINNPLITNQGQAEAAYGSTAKDLGQTGTMTSTQNGEQGWNLHADGSASVTAVGPQSYQGDPNAGNLTINKANAGGNGPTSTEKALSTAGDVAIAPSLMTGAGDLATKYGPAAQELKTLGGVPSTVGKIFTGVAVIGTVLSAAQTGYDIKNGNYKDASIHGLDVAVGITGLIVASGPAAPFVAVGALIYGISRLYWGPGTKNW